MTDATRNIGNGIQKTSARPTRVVVDGTGNWWVCDADIDATMDFAAQGCVRHSDVHLVK